MSFERPQISILDARLAEIDRRLRTIQTGLADEPADSAPPRHLTPEPVLPPRVELAEAVLPADPAPDDGELVSQLRSLAAEHERLLESLRALAQPHSAPAQPHSAPAQPHGALAQPERRVVPAAGPVVGLSIGPLASTDALRSFERALADLPGVATVELRGFEGGDRALLDVNLGR